MRPLTTNRTDCFSSYPRSFSSSRHPQPPLDIKSFRLRKSIFNPQTDLALTYINRQHITQIEVPPVQIVHSSTRWLLIQSPRYSHKFFKHLNAGYLGNPYQQLLTLLKNFTILTQKYGFFKPTSAMIFTQRRKIKLWISEDIFDNTPNHKVSEQTGQHEFVTSFMQMVDGQMRDWEQSVKVDTIDGLERLLQWRRKHNRGSMTLQISRHVYCRQNQSVTSFEANQLRFNKKQVSCSLQTREGTALDTYKPDMCISLTIKQVEEPKNQKIRPTYNNLFRAMCESKQTKKSLVGTKPIQGEVRKTKKKFNLTSTSSTLQQFSQRWRSTVGKKSNRQHERHTINNQPVIHSSPLIQQPSIQNELEGLFSDEEEQGIKLGIEGDREELEKIAEQMQEVLIW